MLTIEPRTVFTEHGEAKGHNDGCQKAEGRETIIMDSPVL